MNKNRSARSAFLDRKSWKGYGSHKGYGKRRASKLDRKGAKFAIRAEEN